MDINLSAVGSAPREDRAPEPKNYQKIQSDSGFEGVRNTVDTQLRQAVGQASQPASMLMQKHGEVTRDKASGRFVLVTTNPKTGQVDKYPSDAQLAIAAAIKQQLEKDIPLPGEYLDAKL